MSPGEDEENLSTSLSIGEYAINEYPELNGCIHCVYPLNSSHVCEVESRGTDREHG